MRPLRSGFLFGQSASETSVDRLSPRQEQERQAQVYRTADRLRDDFGPLWERVSAEFGIAVDRNADWMRWRLFAKPGEKYRCVGLKSRRRATSSASSQRRSQTSTERAFATSWKQSALAERRADLTSLLVGELARAAREGAEIALAWCPRAAPNHVAHRKAGFVPVPPRFRPIEINFGAKSLSRPVTTTVSDWYLSFLDSDTN